MPDCQFVVLDGNGRACRVCGFVIHSPHPAERIYRRCRDLPVPDPRPPTPVTQRPITTEAPDTIVPIHLAADVAAYCRSGQAARTAAEIERLLAACRCCELFTGNNCRAMDTSCCHRRDWIWALVGFGTAPRDCPRKKWG
jgi:hypothetical protein